MYLRQVKLWVSEKTFGNRRIDDYQSEMAFVVASDDGDERLCGFPYIIKMRFIPPS
jgi:hypothetical protein